MTVRIAEKAGFCFGVRRAADALENALSEKERTGSGRRIVTLGHLIHNDEYINQSAREARSARRARTSPILSAGRRRVKRSPS